MYVQILWQGQKAVLTINIEEFEFFGIFYSKFQLVSTFAICSKFWEKVYFRSQILERPSIGEYWNIFGVPVLPENVILRSLERAGGIQKQTILEHQNGLVLPNTRVPVSGTWSILFPNFVLKIGFFPVTWSANE